MIFAGETEVLGENLPSATLSTTSPTWIDPGSNPGLRGERPATNRLSHGTAWQRLIQCNNLGSVCNCNFFQYVLKIIVMHFLIPNQSKSLQLGKFPLHDDSSHILCPLLISPVKCLSSLFYAQFILWLQHVFLKLSHLIDGLSNSSFITDW
jgi:hypothetical protein